ncbi:MAG: rubredoxin-like domain-containing protein, partial [Lachnospiraceae bacterium]
TAGEVLSKDNSVTYGYYQKNIKPAPAAKKIGYVCKICGYIHEENTLPKDFICPICKHGAIDLFFLFQEINSLQY